MQRHVETDRLCYLEIDDELKLAGLQHWKIAGLLPLEDATDIHARLPGSVRHARAIGREAAALGKLARPIDGGKGVLHRQCGESRGEPHKGRNRQRR